MRLCLLVLACFVAANAQADFDPAGPSVDWVGQIVSQAPHNEDTCFTLRRARHAEQADTPQTFKVCALGYFNAHEFQTGHWLEARGILQPKGSDNLPLVAAAGVSPTEAPYDPRYYRDPMWMGPGFGYPMMMRPWRMYPYPMGYPYAW